MQDSALSLSFAPEALRRLNKGAACLGAVALLVLSGAMAPAASAQTASGSTGLDASGNPKSEMAACQSRKTAQDRATCMNEARTAQAARRAGQLENYGDFSANALKRCEVFKEADDLKACRERVLQPTIEGSVAEGGILREAQIEVSTSPGMMQGMDPRAGTGTATNPGSTGTPGTTGAGTGADTGTPSGSGTMPMDTPPRPMPQQ